MGTIWIEDGRERKKNSENQNSKTTLSSQVSDDCLGDKVLGQGGGGHASHFLRLRLWLRGQTKPTRETGCQQKMVREQFKDMQRLEERLKHSN